VSLKFVCNFIFGQECRSRSRCATLRCISDNLNVWINLPY